MRRKKKQKNKTKRTNKKTLKSLTIIYPKHENQGEPKQNGIVLGTRARTSRMVGYCHGWNGCHAVVGKSTRRTWSGSRKLHTVMGSFKLKECGRPSRKNENVASGASEKGCAVQSKSGEGGREGEGEREGGRRGGRERGKGERKLRENSTEKIRQEQSTLNRRQTTTKAPQTKKQKKTTRKKEKKRKEKNSLSPEQNLKHTRKHKNKTKLNPITKKTESTQHKIPKQTKKQNKKTQHYHPMKRQQQYHELGQPQQRRQLHVLT